MIASHQHHVGAGREQIGDDRIRFFDDSDLPIEIAVLAGAVGALYMDEEEIIVPVILLEHLEFFLHIIPRSGNLHAGQPG